MMGGRQPTPEAPVKELPVGGALCGRCAASPPHTTFGGKQRQYRRADSLPLGRGLGTRPIQAVYTFVRRRRLAEQLCDRLAISHRVYT